MRRARQSSVTVGSITLTVRRPTDLEMLDMRGAKLLQSDILKKFVDDWSGVTELDLIPGGTPTPVPFSKELFAEWVADHPESWTAISTAVVDGYKKHEEELALSIKN